MRKERVVQYNVKVNDIKMLDLKNVNKKFMLNYATYVIQLDISGIMQKDIFSWLPKTYPRHI